MKIMLKILFLILLSHGALSQQIPGSTLGDFVGQLTNFFNQNGGINGLGSALQQGPDGGFGLYKPQYPHGPQYHPQYPEYPPRPYPVAPPYAPYPRPQPPIPQGPANQGFFSALASIARYDDLRCVPRLLCEVTSGGKPGYSGSQQSVVPLTNKDSLIALLTVLNFIDDSPLLVFGRAALLGYTSRGNSRTCLTAYPTCPRDPDALVDYLNNHNGGFFRYFSGHPNQGYQQNYPYYPGQEYRPVYDSRPVYRPYSKGHYPRYAGKYTAAKDYYQERIQVRPQPILSEYQEYKPYQEVYQQRPHDKLVFPTRNGKQLHFPQSNHQVAPVSFFPDRTGTGKLLLDNQGVHYAPPHNLINFRDQRSIKMIKFPIDMNFPKS